MKTEQYKLLTLAIVLCVLGLLIWQFSKPIKTKFAWEKTYGDGKTQPYDFGVFEQMVQLNTSKNFVLVSERLEDVLKASDVPKTIYIRIGEQANYNQKEVDELLNFVEMGGQAWLSTENVSDNLLKEIGEVDSSFKFGVFRDSNVNIRVQDSRSKSFEYNISTRGYGKKSINFDWRYLSGLSLRKNISPLGTVDGVLNYVVISRGKGKLFLHSSPIMFSNYLLNNDSGYLHLSAVFEDFNFENILFDKINRNKELSNRSDNKRAASPLAYVLKQKPLRWAWYLILMMTILYFAFYTKRKQKFIPIWSVKKDFDCLWIDSLVALHLNKGDYKMLSALRMKLFMSHLRQVFKLSEDQIESKDYKQIAIKIGGSEEQVKLLFEHYQLIQHSNRMSSERFIEWNKIVNELKKKTNKN